ncbi:MAG: CDP-alcohol phosphatidyltransferase family protein, partial [Candidatus Marinimicrobia bacterium]|nr:CDP-alcohol phosphatidyltransferase family protein [Candidatus Neomarinimicrobiota bacterium]
LTAANKVTLIRLGGVPVFVLILEYYLISLHRGAPAPALRWLALGIFLILAASDALDGYLARSRQEITRLGKLLDPLADKILSLAALLMLTRPSQPALTPQIPVWFTTLVLSRDVFLLAGAALIHGLAGRVEVRPSRTGKAATAALGLAIVATLAGAPQTGLNLGLAAIAFLIAVSAGQYLLAGIRQLEAVPGLLHHDPH